MMISQEMMHLSAYVAIVFSAHRLCTAEKSRALQQTAADEKCLVHPRCNTVTICTWYQAPVEVLMWPAESKGNVLCRRAAGSALGQARSRLGVRWNDLRPYMHGIYRSWRWTRPCTVTV